MGSFIKFREQTRSGNKVLHWNRANLDGAPFRGPAVPPLLKEEEWENLTERVWDVHVVTLDTTLEEDHKHLVDILEGAMNQWYRVLHMERHFMPDSRSMLVYVEYAVPFSELPPDKTRGLTSQILTR